MKRKECFFLAVAALAFASCSNDDDLNMNNEPVEARISAGVSNPLTRAIDNLWEADEIGVMVKEVTGTTSNVTSVMKELYKNVKYSTNSKDKTATFTAIDNKGIFFQDASERVTFAAYGPYQNSEPDQLPGLEGVISDKSTAEQNTRDKQKAFDFIYASGAEAWQQSPDVIFNESHPFAHKMTRLIIEVMPGTDNDITIDDLTKEGTSYILGGLNHSGQFDITTGTAKATGTEVVNDWSLSTNSLKDTKETDTKVTFISILYPQDLKNTALTFKAIIDNQTYTNSDKIKPKLEAGYTYTYTITVKKTGILVSECIISDWTPGDSGIGDAEM